MVEVLGISHLKRPSDLPSVNPACSERESNHFGRMRRTRRVVNLSLELRKVYPLTFGKLYYLQWLEIN